MEVKLKKYLIVGGVAGGATTAARLRRLDEEAEIIVFERGEHISYANCGLPYYIGGKIEERDKLFVQTPESFGNRFNLDVRVKNEVLAIDRENKKVKVRDIEKSKEYTESYDKLILSPGANPIKPPIPGIDIDTIFTLRNVADTDRIKNYIEEKNPQRAVIVGAGFIGLEMAENLHELGIYTTIVEMADQVMQPIDYEMAAEVHQHLKVKDVEFYLQDGVKAFKQKDDTIQAILDSNRKIETDMVILSVGVKPENELAKEAGLAIGESGGIKVNRHLQTDDEDIYAIGDAIEFQNPIIDKKMTTYLAGPANRQGRLCADNIVKGNKREYSGTVGTSIAKVFDLTVASTGLAEKTLREAGIDYKATITHSGSHAGYYPGSKPMSIKINYSPDNGKLYGAQIVGYEGVDKRIDLIATILKNEGNIYDLQKIEQGYAPPYSSAKDPVNIAGYAAENIVEGLLDVVHWHDVQDIDFRDTFLLDVRIPEEYEMGAISGAENIPLDDLRDNLDKVPRNKKIYVYCAVGLRGYIASRILLQNGFDKVYNLTGGIKTYNFATQKQSNEDIFDQDYIGKDDDFHKKLKTKTPSLDSSEVIEVDACGLQCPGPIMRLKEEIDNINPGDVIKIQASDPGFFNDAKSWTNMTGHKLLDIDSESGVITAEIKKQGGKELSGSVPNNAGQGNTLIVFSNDLDKTIASFIIANGAAASGKDVTMFFTFWGLTVLKKEKRTKVKKGFIGKLFDKFLPANTKSLDLSKMSMFGIGKKFIRYRMKQKNVDSLEKMIDDARKNGVKMIACQMSMDLMGIKKEELIDGIEVGGVANYLEASSQTNNNLFI